MNRSFVTLGLAVTVLAAAVGIHAQQQPHRGHGKPPTLVRQFVGGGGWQSRGRADRQSWQVQMKHFDDDSLVGRVTIIGSPVLDHAQIQGQITSSEVDGVLLDDNGRQVGTFSGAMTNSTLAGTYTTADGDIGSWSWDGELPK